jgi:phosphate/sulfate permease
MTHKLAHPSIWFQVNSLKLGDEFSDALLGHGTNDSQKGMGIITTVLVAGGLLKAFSVPFWVII